MSGPPGLSDRVKCGRPGPVPVRNRHHAAKCLSRLRFVRLGRRPMPKLIMGRQCGLVQLSNANQQAAVCQLVAVCAISARVKLFNEAIKTTCCVCPKINYRLVMVFTPLVVNTAITVLGRKADMCSALGHVRFVPISAKKHSNGSGNI